MMAGRIRACHPIGTFHDLRGPLPRPSLLMHVPKYGCPSWVSTLQLYSSTASRVASKLPSTHCGRQRFICSFVSVQMCTYICICILARTYIECMYVQVSIHPCIHPSIHPSNTCNSAFGCKLLFFLKCLLLSSVGNHQPPKPWTLSATVAFGQPSARNSKTLNPQPCTPYKNRKP